MDDKIFGFSKTDAERIAEATRRVLGMPPRGLNQSRRSSLIVPPIGIYFHNDASEAMPPGAIGAIKSYDVSSDGNFFFAEIEKPGTTFRKQYLVNTAVEAIPADGIGFCEFRSSYRIAHDTSWAPATGESGGPKPGSWLLWKGYPSICSVIGRADEANDILLGTLGEIGTLLCKAVAQTASGTFSSTSAYTIMQGTAGSEASAGFTTQPTIYSRSDIMINEWFYATFRNGVWYADLDDNSWLGKADSAIAAASSGTVSLWTGTQGSESDSGSNATSIYNRTSVDIPSGGWVHIGRVNGKFYGAPWSC